MCCSQIYSSSFVTGSLLFIDFKSKEDLKLGTNFEEEKLYTRNYVEFKLFFCGFEADWNSKPHKKKFVGREECSSLESVSKKSILI